jgi:hypothetical protein
MDGYGIYKYSKGNRYEGLLIKKGKFKKDLKFG